MLSLQLSTAKAEFIQALRVLGPHRHRRFSGVLPIWLHYDASGHLSLTEDRGKVRAFVPATGTWPAAGVTVDLFLLQRAAERVGGGAVDLIATNEAVLVPTKKGHIALKLLPFGPGKPQRRRDPIPVVAPPSTQYPTVARSYARLPLFRWAAYSQLRDANRRDGSG
jgi:hypothetical protein